MPDRNWKAFESEHKDFDENGDDDSNDLDKNFDVADPEPEHSATVDMQGPIARSKEDVTFAGRGEITSMKDLWDSITNDKRSMILSDLFDLKSDMPKHEIDVLAMSDFDRVANMFDGWETDYIRKYVGESYKQEQIEDPNPAFSYDGKKREGVYDANKERKGANEVIDSEILAVLQDAKNGNKITDYSLEQLKALADARMLGLINERNMGSYIDLTNAGMQALEEANTPWELMSAQGKPSEISRSDYIGTPSFGESKTVYKHQSGLVNGTESYETVDVDFSETDSAVEFTCNCGVRVTEANLPKHMEEAHGSKLTEARYKTYKTQHNIGINESDANVKDIGMGKKTRAGESYAKEGAYDNLSEDAKFIVANHYDGLSREDKEEWSGQMSPDTKFVDLSKEIQDIWVESWDYDKESKASEDAIGSYVDSDDVILDDQYNMLNRDGTTIHPTDDDGNIRGYGSRPFDKAPVDLESKSSEDFDEQSINQDFQSLDNEIADATDKLNQLENDLANARTVYQQERLEEDVQKAKDRLTDLERDRDNLEMGVFSSEPKFSQWESRKVWKSYEMEDEYAYEEEDDVKVSLNVNDGTLTDKPIEHTDEHHTISDIDSTSPDDEGFSTNNIGSGNYSKSTSYNPEPNKEIGSRHLTSKKGQRNSQDNPASETQTFYSNIVGKLSGMEFDYEDTADDELHRDLYYQQIDEGDENEVFTAVDYEFSSTDNVSLIAVADFINRTTDWLVDERDAQTLAKRWQDTRYS